MNSSAAGLWDIAEAALCSIGRGAARLMRRKISSDKEYAVYAMIGGALLCTAFGAVIGFALSDLSQNASIEGAIIGGLLGACVGIFLGASVDAVDSTIQAALKSFKSK